MNSPKRSILANGVLLLLLALLTGCASTRDVTGKVGDRTDYVLGQVYELQQPLFLHKFNPDDSDEIPTLHRLGTRGTPNNLVAFEKYVSSDSNIVGLLRAGDQIRITRFVESRLPTIGSLLVVYAEVVNGPLEGATVDLLLLSKGTTHYTAFVDPEYLVPMK